MKISERFKGTLVDELNTISLKLPEEIVNFFKSGGNLKIKCKEGSGIHIKKKNRGKFTASAKKAGLSVLEHARSVLNNPNATPLQKKRANFARNSKKWKHLEGGIIKALEGTILSGELPPLDITPLIKSIKKEIDNLPLSKDKIRRRLYDNISPFSYQRISERLYDAIIKNKPLPHYGYRDDIFATYLGIPREERHIMSSRMQPILEESKYTPSKDNEKENKKYYSLGDLSNIPNSYYDPRKDSKDKTNLKGVLIEDAFGNVKPLKIGENKISRVLESFLGNHTIGRGYDEKGDYISYYDLWDLNPFHGSTANTKIKNSILKNIIDNKDLSFGIGTPVNIYDRIYLDDYYGVSKPTHSTYLPEVIVKGTRKHKQGGSMRIPGVIDSNPNLDNMKGDYVTPKKKKKKLLQKKFIGGLMLSNVKNTTQGYIGGSPELTRQTYWGIDPDLYTGISDIANKYGIDPEILKYRLSAEGFIDSMINAHNGLYDNYNKLYKGLYGNKLLNAAVNNPEIGGRWFGTDDSKYYIEKGLAKLILGEKYTVGKSFRNALGRMVTPIVGNTIRDNIGIMAALLKMFRTQVELDYPKASPYDKNRYTLAYYNRGRAGGRKWINNGAKGYKYK